MTIEEAIKLFLEHCQYEKNLSAKTLEAYNIDLLQFQKHLQSRNVSVIENINKSDIKAFLQYLSKFEIRTTKRKVASTKALLNFLEFEDFLLVNPYRKIKVRLKQPRQLPTVLDLAEITSLFKTLQSEKDKITNRKSYGFTEKLRDLSIVEMFFATGIRVSELCNIKVSDIDFTEWSISIVGKGNKERLIQICNPETQKTLTEYHTQNLKNIQSSGFFLSAG